MINIFHQVYLKVTRKVEIRSTGYQQKRPRNRKLSHRRTTAFVQCTMASLTP